MEIPQRPIPEHAASRVEGRRAPGTYRFAAREIGEALVSVAKRTTYRAAAEVARRKAGRVPVGNENRRRRSPANEGQLVANWVDGGRRRRACGASSPLHTRIKPPGRRSSGAWMERRE
jgi:hypothetical protein